MHRFALAVLTVIAIAPSAHAGSIGVTNSWGHSTRTGTGTTVINVTGSSQLTETSTSSTSKTETGRTADHPGNGNGNANGLGSSYDATAASTLNRTYTESTNFTQATNEAYSFGATNFSHSISTFAE